LILAFHKFKKFVPGAKTGACENSNKTGRVKARVWVAAGGFQFSDFYGLIFDVRMYLMSIRRVVPNIKSKSLEDSRAFYVDVLGFKVGMDMGFIVTLVSPSNPF